METKEKTIEECINNIQQFANKHKLVFQDEGECGVGRKCVGLMVGDNYVDYNPTEKVNYDYIAEFYDKRFYEAAPPDAYHKHDCLAVLGRGDNAIRQLSEWVDKLNEIGVTVERYKTGATGIQALMTGIYGSAVKVIS